MRDQQLTAPPLLSLAGRVDFEEPLHVSDLFGPDDSWLEAPRGGWSSLAGANAVQSTRLGVLPL